jgi:heat shock protein beta
VRVQIKGLILLSIMVM